MTRGEKWAGESHELARQTIEGRYATLPNAPAEMPSCTRSSLPRLPRTPPHPPPPPPPNPQVQKGEVALWQARVREALKLWSQTADFELR